MLIYCLWRFLRAFTLVRVEFVVFFNKERICFILQNYFSKTPVSYYLFTLHFFIIFLINSPKSYLSPQNFFFLILKNQSLSHTISFTLSSYPNPSNLRLSLSLSLTHTHTHTRKSLLHNRYLPCHHRLTQNPSITNLATLVDDFEFSHTPMVRFEVPLHHGSPLYGFLCYQLIWLWV